jgi:hypothetical protein
LTASANAEKITRPIGVLNQAGVQTKEWKMGLLTEQLEPRLLFAGAPIPAPVAAAYAVLIRDDATLKSEGKTYTAALGAHVKTLAAEVKSLGKGSSNNALVGQIMKDAAAITSADVSDTNKFVSVANGVFHSTELAEAAFTAKPNLANGHKLVAEVNACTALENAYSDARFEPLVGKAADAYPALLDALGQLPAASLPAVTSINNDLNNLGENQADAAQATMAAIPALLEE